LLAVDCVRTDGGEAVLVCEPIVPNSGIDELVHRLLVGIDQNAVIDVDQCRIMFDEDLQIPPIFEIGSSGPVHKRIGIRCCGRIQRGLGVSSGLAVPVCPPIRGDAGRLPKPKLQSIRTAIAGAHEWGALRGDLRESLGGIL
jgi:hypothetical protein